VLCFVQQQKPWLLRSIRVAVHMRRGDITQNVRHLNRLLPLRFYINVLKQLTQVCVTIQVVALCVETVIASQSMCVGVCMSSECQGTALGVQ
jgi:hypothetical protein